MKPLSNEEQFLKLQTLNLSKNKITELLQIKCPKLLKLNLNQNNIDKIDAFDGHPKLKMLSLRNNKINVMT
jgi:Leucine-rich repeat (LRR) protein